MEDDTTRKSRMHAQTLSELNHCVGTARSDAAYLCLREIAERNTWPPERTQRAAIYQKCLTLVKEAIDTTVRYSLMHCNPKQALWDKPVIHFLHLIQQLLQTLNSLAEHVNNVQSEAELLSEHLGCEVYNVLESTCKDFETHERMGQYALRKTLAVGQILVERNSTKRRETFTPDDIRRYDKSLQENLEHFRAQNQC